MSPFLVTLFVWMTGSALLGGTILGLIYLVRRQGVRTIKYLYTLQLTLTAIVVAVLARNAAAEIKANPLDGPAGMFQGMEAGIALFLGLGSQIFVLIGMPWLIARTKQAIEQKQPT